MLLQYLRGMEISTVLMRNFITKLGNQKLNTMHMEVNTLKVEVPKGKQLIIFIRQIRNLKEFGMQKNL
jgi:hypothetical protein